MIWKGFQVTRPLTIVFIGDNKNNNFSWEREKTSKLMGISKRRQNMSTTALNQETKKKNINTEILEFIAEKSKEGVNIEIPIIVFSALTISPPEESIEVLDNAMEKIFEELRLRGEKKEEISYQEISSVIHIILMKDYAGGIEKINKYIRKKTSTLVSFLKSDHSAIENFQLKTMPGFAKGLLSGIISGTIFNVKNDTEIPFKKFFPLLELIFSLHDLKRVDILNDKKWKHEIEKSIEFLMSCFSKEAICELFNEIPTNPQAYEYNIFTNIFMDKYYHSLKRYYRLKMIKAYISQEYKQ